jgi:hypothetical protein
MAKALLVGRGFVVNEGRIMNASRVINEAIDAACNVINKKN